jgi:uncharacterized protein (TIGR02271 family)
VATTVQDYREMTRQDLYALAQERDIAGRSRLSKDELAEALELDDVGPDVVVLLVEQHEEIRDLFARFEQLSRRPSKKKHKLVHDILTYLMRHAQVEEQIFYPAVRTELPDLRFEVDQDLEEHHVAEILLSELEALPASSPRYDAKVAVLIASMRSHLDDEEEQLFPRVQDEFDELARRQLGAEVASAWLSVPVRPQVHVADGPAVLEDDAVAVDDVSRPDADVADELVADAAAADDALKPEPADRERPAPSGTDVDAPGADADDGAMTRSEEELVVDTTTREAGTARLRKQVVTEHVTETVPVERERPVVEREPISDEDVAGEPVLAEDERQITLHDEEVVTEKRTVPKERVRLEKGTRTDFETVEGEVDREDVEVELVEPGDPDGPEEHVIDVAAEERSRQR